MEDRDSPVRSIETVVWDTTYQDPVHAWHVVQYDTPGWLTWDLSPIARLKVSIEILTDFQRLIGRFLILHTKL
ncbi:MAG: hypothetical protein KBD21_04045 [Candidatus Pacebacteria bacterium]|nr:hypothetical protein [Candidatus Paceibacterota bacterium]